MEDTLKILMQIKEDITDIKTKVSCIEERSLNTQNDTRYLTQQFDSFQDRIAKAEERVGNNCDSIRSIRNSMWGILSAIMLFVFVNYLIKPYFENDTKYIKPRDTIQEVLDDSED